jgi:uncharacterized membrane protein
MTAMKTLLGGKDRSERLLERLQMYRHCADNAFQMAIGFVFDKKKLAKYI